MLGLLIQKRTPYSVPHVTITHGEALDTQKVLLQGTKGPTRLAADAKKMLDDFTAFLTGGSRQLPTLQLNSHCGVCEFQERCRAEAEEKDDISLLSGLSASEILEWRSRGNFTVTQLAHAFRPRRYCRPGYEPKQHSQPLQARAVTEQTIFVRKKPTIPSRNGHEIRPELTGFEKDSPVY